MLKKSQKPVKDETQIAQDILIEEVNDDVHNEMIVQAWNKYKYLIIAAIILVVGGLAAMEGYFSWRTKTRMGESDIYEQAAVLNAMGQTDEALAKYASLDNGKTTYRYLAQMRRAGILFDDGKDKEGLELLNALRQNTDAPETLRAIAALGYVSQQVETGNAAELQSVLNPYMTIGNVWYGTAVELSTLLLIREGELDKANKQIDETLSMSDVPAGVKERLTIMKKVLEK